MLLYIALLKSLW